MWLKEMTVIAFRLVNYPVREDLLASSPAEGFSVGYDKLHGCGCKFNQTEQIL
jgi:hypothetical protein